MAKLYRNPLIDKAAQQGRENSKSKSQVITIKMIDVNKLVPHPKNQEDISNTADLEYSISRLGFTDPLEVTGFGQPKDTYIIISGHRRREAAMKLGMTTLPCLIIDYDNEMQVLDRLLSSNLQRNETNDPLLYSVRYKMHEEYLKEIGFSGNIHEEISKRLGISTQQAYRYAAMNNVILPIWEMIRNGDVGISSVTPLAVLSPDEQAEIYTLFSERLSTGEPLTRDNAKQIIDNFKESRATVKGMDEKPAAAGADKNAKITPIDTAKENKTPSAGSIIKQSEKLYAQLNSHYKIKNDQEAEIILKNLAGTILSAVSNLQEISRAHHLENDYRKLIEALGEKLKTL